MEIPQLVDGRIFYNIYTLHAALPWRIFMWFSSRLHNNSHDFDWNSLRQIIARNAIMTFIHNITLCGSLLLHIRLLGTRSVNANRPIFHGIDGPHDNILTMSVLSGALFALSTEYARNPHYSYRY